MGLRPADPLTGAIAASLDEVMGAIDSTAGDQSTNSNKWTNGSSLEVNASETRLKALVPNYDVINPLIARVASLGLSPIALRTVRRGPLFGRALADRNIPKGASGRRSNVA